MPDFPAAVPDVPDMIPGNPLATAHGAVSHTVGLNRTLANVLALATKLGTVTGSPAPRKVLAGAASGQSGWVDYVAGATLVVAALDASASSKAVANYVCTGTADDLVIGAAMTALPAGGGTVRLTEGTFALANPFGTSKANSHIVGAGMDATILRVANAAGSPVNTTLVQLNHASCSVRDLTVDGNKANNAAQTNMIGIGVAAAGVEALVERVRVRNSAAHAFVVGPSGAGTRLVSCIADSNTGQGFIVRSASALGQVLVDRCISRSNDYGFNSDSGPVTFINCVAISSVNNGFNVTAAQTRLIGCDAYANANCGMAVGGAFSEVIDCRIVQNTNHGLYGTAGSADALIVGNQVVSNGQFGLIAQGARSLVVGNRAHGNGTAADNSYSNFLIGGGDTFVDGNIARRGTAANRPSWGIYVSDGANNYLGGNDLYDSGASGLTVDGGTNTRRLAKLQLDYVLASDYLGVTQPAGTWLALHPDQTFRVDSPVNMVEISVRGSANVGPSVAVAMEMGMRILVDGVVYRLGGAALNPAVSFMNPFAGSGALSLSGLAAGNHTVRVEMVATQSAYVYLRAASYTNAEHIAIQVMEYAS